MLPSTPKQFSHAALVGKQISVTVAILCNLPDKLQKTIFFAKILEGSNEYLKHLPFFPLFVTQ